MNTARLRVLKVRMLVEQLLVHHVKPVLTKTKLDKIPVNHVHQDNIEVQVMMRLLVVLLVVRERTRIQLVLLRVPTVVSGGMDLVTLYARHVQKVGNVEIPIQI